MAYYVYILKCSDASLYTGYTNNLEKRVKTHNESKKGAKYTRSRRPVRLVYFERFKTLSSALKKECKIKSLTQKQKIELIKSNLKTT
jgi:putative endonuclease